MFENIILVHPRIPKDSRRPRYEALIEKFESTFQAEPYCIVRTPGRVNLIGEHIDYSGYSVMPMAIELDVIAAVRYTSHETTRHVMLRIANVDPTYRTFVCRLDQMDIAPPLAWYQYILCGIKGVLDNAKKFGGPKHCPGIDILVDGRVPLAAGLSSSSALVCCAAVTTAYGMQMLLDKIRLSDVSAECEKYIGVQGGGMDQAISIMAVEGKAKLIDFNPLTGTDVQLPNNAVFVISNTCVMSCKASTSYYNTRVVECILAAKLIAIRCKVDLNKVKILRDVEKQIPDETPLQLIERIIHSGTYARSELIDIFEISNRTFNATYMNAQTVHLNEFNLYSRALHVFQEAKRVMEFKEICDSKQPDPEKITNLGILMNASHDSCRDLYDCSCPELDEMVDIARNIGAVGSRLTGAGWGGCVVSLVRTHHVKRFINSLRELYYEKDPYRDSLKEKSVFVSSPGCGAVIHKIEYDP